MSHNLNTVKSQDELNSCNEGKRKSDVLLASIDELEKVKKEICSIKNYMKQLRSVIQSANFEDIRTDYKIEMIKIIDNLLYRGN